MSPRNGTKHEQKQARLTCKEGGRAGDRETGEREGGTDRRKEGGVQESIVLHVHPRMRELVFLGMTGVNNGSENKSCLPFLINY